MKGLLLYEMNESGNMDWNNQIQKMAKAQTDISSFQELEEIIERNTSKTAEAFCIREEVLQKGGKERLTVSINGTGHDIACKEILYAESDKRKVKIVTEEKEYSVYMKMDQLEKQLPEYFLRTHKSYLVNMNMIQNFSREDVILKNGVWISISRARCKEARKKFEEYTK